MADVGQELTLGAVGRFGGLFGAMQGVHRAPALGDIPKGYHRPYNRAPLAERAAHILHGQRQAILAPIHILTPLLDGSRAQRGPGGTGLPRIRGAVRIGMVEPRMEGVPEQFVDVVAGHLRGRGIGKDDLSLLVQPANPFTHRLQDEGVPLGELLQRRRHRIKTVGQRREFPRRVREARARAQVAGA